MASRMAAAIKEKLPSILLSLTRMGGGVTQNGVAFPGGLDQTTPSLQLQPGCIIGGVNFECSQSGGYGRIGGYERYDGHAAPSSALYGIVQVSAFANLPTVGQTITQATSGATGYIIAVVNQANLLLNEWGGVVLDEDGYPIIGNYTCYVAVTKVTGSFDFTHTLTTPGPVVVGVAIPTTVSISAMLNAQYLALAADVYRANITAVPGSGSILGVVAMQFGSTDYVYAFRNNTGGTATNLYVNSSTGWVQVPFFDIVHFTAGVGPGGSTGTYEPPDGTTITQGGVTATVKRVMWQSGSFASGTGTAVGALVITAPTGGNFSAASATLGDGSTVTLAGVQAAITLLPNGKFQFEKTNFSGQFTTRRIYGCDGVNPAFEFDGTTLAPITTGVTPNAPSLIASHQYYLILGYGSSLVGCGAGTPFKWDAIDGGWEIATGDILTGFITLPGSQTTSTMAVFMQHNTGFLYGTDPTTFNLSIFNTGIGALAYSVQNLFDCFYFDMLGAVNLRTTLNWGNFLPSALNRNILPFVQQERQKLVASTILRQKSQYRIFFSDGYGLYTTFVNGQNLGAIPVQFPNPVYCVDSEKTSLNSEVTYFGSNDGMGYVYQLDSGTGFDGQPLNAYITLAWDAIKSPRILKKFRRASIEVQGSAYSQISFGFRLGYGDSSIGTPANVNYPSNFNAPYWDQFTWDAFTWDGQTLSPTTVDMTGSGENVQITIASTTNYIAPFNVNSAIYHYSKLRALR
jgi:hypothetical protein